MQDSNRRAVDSSEQMAADRATVIADAKKLHPQVKTDGCSCEQIKRDVVTVKSGDALVKAIIGNVAIGDAKPDAAPASYYNGDGSHRDCHDDRSFFII